MDLAAFGEKKKRGAEAVCGEAEGDGDDGKKKKMSPRQEKKRGEEPREEASPPKHIQTTACGLDPDRLIAVEELNALEFYGVSEKVQELATAKGGQAAKGVAEEKIKAITDGESKSDQEKRPGEAMMARPEDERRDASERD